jgi:hypothetical protein
MKQLLLCLLVFFASALWAPHVDPSFASHLPLYNKVVGLDDKEMPIVVDDEGFRAATDLAVSQVDLVEKIFAKLYDWQEEFTLVLHFDFVEEDLQDILEGAFQEALAKNDYIAFSISRYGFSYSSIANYAEVEFEVDLLTDRKQEEEIDAAVQEVLMDMQVWHKNPREKVRAVHDWIVNNVEYDLGKTRRSAHDALFDGKTAVCQGYVLLAYAMLSELNLKTCIIEGLAGKERENHAWNMVNISGEWLHLDMTHDDPVLYTGTDTRTILDDEAKRAYFAGMGRDPQYKFFLLRDDELLKVDPHRKWER